MIAFLKGTLAYKDAESVIIETGGIGYQLAMPLHALTSLPQVGSTVQVWTYMHVKEDDISLFGFTDPTEKDLFTKLISISGVGPKMAISALSTYKPNELVAAIGAGDVTAISKIQGIGKKTAQRMILELQGLLKTDVGTENLFSEPDNEAMHDAAAALESMGFSSQEVSEALKCCTESTTSGIIRYALKHMGGSR